MATTAEESEDEALALAIGMELGERAHAHGGADDAGTSATVDADGRANDRVLRAMDRLGARVRTRRDEALIADARALGREASESEEEEEEEEAGGCALATTTGAAAQGSRALQILKTNPQVRNASQEHMFLPAIHKSLAPKIRTEMKTSTFRPKLPTWAETKKEHLAITGDLGAIGKALEANQNFQLDVRAMLESIDDKLARSATLLTEVQRCKNRKGRRVHWSLQESMFDIWGQKSELYFRVPSAWTPSQKTPNALPSEDVTGIVSQLNLQKQITPNADQLRLGWANLVDKIPLSYASHCRSWTPKEDEQLRKGVHFQLQQARLLTDQRMSLEELAGISLQSLETLLVAGGLDVIARDADAIQWEEVVRMHMPQRTVDDCRLRWMNVVDPRICQTDWTDGEDERLVQLAEEMATNRDWTLIAQELHASNRTPGGLVRSPHQCAVRYQAEWNPGLVKSTWTPEEDETVKSWVREHGKGNWTKLAGLLPGHTGQQILHRWRRLQPNRRIGAWTKEEDEALRVAVSAYSGGERIKWSLVQEHVPTRTDVQCRERWTGVLDPSIKTGAWTKEEDTALMSALGWDFEEKGFNEWARLSEVVPGRTGKNCMRRGKALMKKKQKADAAAVAAAAAAATAEENGEAAPKKRQAAPKRSAAVAAEGTSPSAEPTTKRRVRS